MTKEKDDIQIINKAVVTLDICSSSHLIEDLLKTNNIKVWRDLLIGMKDYLLREADKYSAEMYKFTGDGWIILFDEPYSGKLIFDLLSGIYQEFDAIYTNSVYVSLDIPPEIYGLTFGIDEGPLIQMEMQDKNEYIGRPINVACRLQGVIDEIDIKGGFRVFMSHRLFHLLKDDLSEYDPEAIERPLRNISGGADFRCFRLAISDTQFRIVKATYGTKNNPIDVTQQYTKCIKNGRLNLVVSNEIAGNDPDEGSPKVLSVKYIHDGKTYERHVKERALIQIP